MRRTVLADVQANLPPGEEHWHGALGVDRDGTRPDAVRAPGLKRRFQHAAT